MKKLNKFTLLTGLLVGLMAEKSATGATTIISDTYNVTTSGTGFGLNAGVNTGINPPTTRLTGSTISNLRYLHTVTTRPASAYDINSSRARVTTGNTIGRFTISANGSTPFDFGPALGTAYATPANPMSYDVKIGLRNDATGNPRFSLGLATVEGDINNMDFALQLYRASSGNTFYTIQKRIDRGSFNGTATTDGTGDLNAVLTTTGAGTVATMIDFLIRVTDAGAESGANYNSRIQVSINNGSTWIYDTSTDAAVLNRFRFDGTERYFAFDQAPNTTGNVFYDNFSVTWNSGSRTWTGAGANGNWNTAANWGGAVPVSGGALTFNGTTRQTSTNDLSGLSVPCLKFNNGGFALYGNALTVSSAITNSTGNSALNSPLTLGGAVRLQSDAGTLTLGGTITGGANNLIAGGAGNTTISGTISGTGSLTKSDAGTLQLSGASANTFSGGTMVNAGVLSLAKTAGVNAIAGNVTLGDGAGADVLRLNAANQIPDSSVINISSSGLFDLNGFNETVASVSSASANSQVALGIGTLTVDAASASAFAGSISGTGNVTKQGAGTLTLSGANSFSGTASINAGVVNLQNAAALGSSGSTIVGSGAALELGGGIAVAGKTLTVNGGGISSGGALRNINGDNSWSGAVTIGSAARIHSDSGTLTISGGVGGAQSLTVGGGGNTTISGAIASGSLTKDGSGVLQLSGASANTYSGNAFLNAGTLSLAKTAGINAVSGNVTVGDDAGADVLRLNAANQIPDSATVTISASGLFDLNGFGETVASVSSSSVASQIALGAGTLTVGDASASTFSGVISGTGNLVKKGSGTMTLSGANTHSGLTTIDAGQLTVASGGSIASSSCSINSGATLDVSGITFSLASGKTLECKSTSGKAEVIGNVTWNSGAQFVLNANGGSGMIGRLDVDGNITLNNCVATVNVTGGALNLGTYALITHTGSRSGLFNTTPTISGSGLASGLAARITHTSGLVALHVYNPSATNTVFKVMHYNVHFGMHNGVSDTTTTSQYITNNNIDIVGMNEVDRFRDRSNNKDLPAEYSNKTGYTCVFSNNMSTLPGNDESGNAILSKFPVLYREHILLPNIGSNEQRGLLKTIVDVKGKFVSFWSTHLDFRSDNTERLMCVTNFNTWVQDEVFPTIISGDFNETPDKATHARMELEWEDIWLEAGDGSLGRTVPCPGPTAARIDYIWRVKGNTLTPTNAFVALGLEKSDHYGIVSKFHLNITTNLASGFYLRCDEGTGTNVLDSVGGLKGTLGTGAPTWNTNTPSGLPGEYSLWFNGSKKLTVTDTKQIIGTNGVNDNYTLQAWVKVAVNYAPTQRAILFQYDRQPGFSFSINTNRTLHTTAFKVQDIASTAALPNDGLWHHVAVVHTDGANMKYYIDGALSATVAYTGGAGYRTSSAITVGSDPDGANPFTGFLARVKFDNRALTASQLDTVAAPSGFAMSGNPKGKNDFETWKSLHGIADSNADEDADGQSNLDEYVAATNPNEATSRFQIIDAKLQSGTMVLSWSSVGGVRYRIQSSDGIAGPFTDIERDETTERDASAFGEPSTQSFTDTLAPTNTVRYYRVKIVP